MARLHLPFRPSHATSATSATWLARSSAAVLVVVGLGCSGSVPLSRYRAVTGGDWPELRPGRRVLVSGASACKGVTVSPEIDDAIDGKGQAPSDVAVFKRGEILTIDETRVQQERGRLGIAGMVNGQRLAIGLPTGGAATCLYSPDVRGWAEAKPLAGKELVFAPWQKACTEVLASGQTPNAALFDSEPGGPIKADRVELRSPLGSPAGTPPVPWIVFAGDALAVPFHVARDCFAEAGRDEAKPPEDLRGALRLASNQCIEDKYKGKTHLECKTSLGTWMVHATPNHVTARLARVTHGAVHFLEGRMVTKEAFATTVLGLSMSASADPRERSLYAAMNEAVATTMAREHSAVRVTVPHDPTVTVAVSLSLAKLTIGELARSETSESTTYPDHEEERPNPKLPEAVERVSTARTAIGAAESELTSAEEDLQQQRSVHQAALNECRKQAANAKGKFAGLAGVGCEVGGALLRPQGRVSDARAALSNAKGALATAEAQVASLPKTIREWIMMPWTYKRVRYERPVSVEVSMRVVPQGGAPQESVTPLRIAIVDDEVLDDPKHKVKGHVPDPALVSRPDELAPRIARQVSTLVAGKLVAVLASEARAATLRALAASGGDANDPDYQLLDATAFEMAGPRMQRTERRGRMTLAGGKIPIPVGTLTVSKDACLLFAAVAEKPATAVVTLEDAAGNVFDRRGANYAVVEICGRDLEKDASPTVLLDGAKGTEVRWGVYRTQ